MNPFREMLNGAVPQTGRDIPIQLNPIAPMSDSDQVLADGNDSAVKLLNELAARKQAFEEMLKGRINSPQMQAPNVQPNKNAALLGGLAALIGALTGDRSAAPAFGQFAGGLQQDAQAKAQRLLQEQQMKMQAQAQKDNAIGDLLGFQLEDAQNAYSRANAADVANRKAAKEAADAEAKRAFEIWKTTTEQQGLTERARMGQEGQNYRSTLNSRPPQQKLFDWLTSDAAGSQKLGEKEAFDFVNKLSERTAKMDLLQKQIEKIAQDIKLAPERLDLHREQARLMAEYRQEMMAQGWTRIDQSQQSLDMRAEDKQQPSYKFEDDPSWYSFEKRMKDLDLESMTHDLKNIQYAADLKKAEGFPDGPQKQQLIKFYNEQIDIRTRRMNEIQAKRIAIRAEQLKREAEIMAAKQTGAGMGRTIGSSPPRMSGSLKPSGAGAVAPLNPMNLPGVQFKPAPSKGKRPLGIFKPR